jgi:putative DNA primase/helicase
MMGRLLPHEAALGLLEAMRAAGVCPRDPGAVLAELLRGDLVRFPCEGDKGKRNGWARLFSDGRPAARFGNWRLGIDHTWSANHRVVRASPADMAAIAARKAQERKAREAWHRQAESEARRLWQASRAANADHPYLAAKRLGAAVVADAQAPQVVVRQAGGDLMILMGTVAGGPCNLQRIGPDGRKRFLPGGRLEGAFWYAGKPRCAPIIAIGGGFATMAAVRLATGLPVIAAMSAGNLEAVAMAIHADRPAARLILCADMDAGPQGNIGQAKANAAAAAVPGALVALPPRPADWPADGRGWDFADTFKAPRGPELIRRALGLKE